MFLTDNQTLEIQLGTTPVSAIQVAIDYADHTARIPVAGNITIPVSSSPTIILSGTTRQIKNITIFNPNSLPAIEIKIIQNYPVPVVRKVVDLYPNQTLQYTDRTGWSI
jgi:hypothetical protein